MNRRGFLGSILAACAAPAIVRASSLMRVIAPPQGIISVEEFFSAGAILDAAPIPMGNRLLTIADVTREALLILEKELRTEFLTAPMVPFSGSPEFVTIRRPGRFGIATQEFTLG